MIAFWRAAGPPRWFAQSARFDRLVGLRLGALRETAVTGALDHWDASPAGALALLVLLDQASRNLFRGSPKAYEADPLAVAVGSAAIDRGFDRRFPGELRQFFYLPFEHAEDPALQSRSVALFRAMGDPEALKWAELHAEIIGRFGRFPHRNAVLGRAPRPEETAYLDAGGFAR